jgi:hypothetical protein
MLDPQKAPERQELLRRYRELKAEIAQHKRNLGEGEAWLPLGDGGRSRSVRIGRALTACYWGNLGGNNAVVALVALRYRQAWPLLSADHKQQAPRTSIKGRRLGLGFVLNGDSTALEPPVSDQSR